jgi:hypothetical protein
MNGFAASLSRMLVIVARQYAKKEVQYDSENVAYEIYSKAIAMWLSHNMRAPIAKQL